MLTWQEVDIIVRDMVSEPSGWRAMTAEHKTADGWTVTAWHRETKRRVEITGWDGWRMFTKRHLRDTPADAPGVARLF